MKRNVIILLVLLGIMALAAFVYFFEYSGPSWHSSDQGIEPPEAPAAEAMPSAPETTPSSPEIPQAFPSPVPPPPPIQGQMPSAQGNSHSGSINQGHGAFANVTRPAKDREESTPSKDPFAAVDQVVAQLQAANLAFNVPEKLNLKATADIRLILSMIKSIDELKQMIEGAGEKEGAEVHVSNQVEARLTGSNFAVTAVSPEIQAIARNETTEWSWEVKPLSTGSQKLHLTLSAVITVDGTATKRTIRTFDKEINVEVTLGQDVKAFFERNWQWLWAAILAPVLGFIWKRRAGRSV